MQVKASSVNRGELALIAMRPAGWIPGQDVAGVVIRSAENDTGPAVGTRVAGLAEEGAWAERVAVPAGRLAEIPDGVSFEQAAALPMAGLTALRTLRTAGPSVGKRLLVTGASGGVGRLQSQLGRIGRMSVTAVTSQAQAVSGADQTVRSPVEAPGLYDIVLESVGGTSLTGAISVAAPGSHIVLFGASGGEKSSLNIYDFIGHENVTPTPTSRTRTPETTHATWAISWA